MGTLVKGNKYDADKMRLLGWSKGDGSGSEGYSLYAYFDADGRYLGADEHGIEPEVEISE